MDEGSRGETGRPDAEDPRPAWQPGTKFCFACGELVDARAEICPQCGVRQPYQPGMPGTGVAVSITDVRTRTGKSKLAASLLAIILGGLGAHKFYLRDTGTGIVYVLFVWTLLPTIFGIVEGILMLTETNESWLAKYGDR